MLTDPSPDRLILWPQHRDSMRLAGLSEATVAARTGILRRLAHGTVDLADIGPGNVRALIAKPALTASSRATHLRHLNSFYKWCVLEELLEVNPTSRIPMPKVPHRLPAPISHEDLLRAVHAATPRTRVWLLLAAYAGLRCAEIAGLRVQDIGVSTLVVTGKGDKTRAIPMHPRLTVELAIWTAGLGQNSAENGTVQPFQGFTGGKPVYLFAGPTGHIDAQSVSWVGNKHLHDLGIQSTMHKLRARFATDVYGASQNIIGTQHLLGHSSIVTTQGYVQADVSKLQAMVDALDYGEVAAG